LRRNIFRICADLDKWQSFGGCLGMQQLQGAGGISLSPLPRHNRIPDVSQAVRRKRCSSGLPAQTDASAELAVPHPASKAGYAGDLRTVWKRYRRALGLSIFQARDKCLWIRFDLCQFLLCGDCSADGVRRPPSTKGENIAREIVQRWTDDLHGGVQDARRRELTGGPRRGQSPARGTSASSNGLGS